MAVYTEQDIQFSNIDPFCLLDNAVYLESGSPIITSKTIPVVENSYVGAMLVRFSDVKSLSESYGISYLDAISAIANDNNIDSNHLAVAVDEETIIEDPEIIDELVNVVVNPISENSLAYIFCESMITSYEETGDEDYLTFLAEEEVPDNTRGNEIYKRFVNKVDEVYDKAKSGAYDNEFVKFKTSDDAKKFIDNTGNFSKKFANAVSEKIKDSDPRTAKFLSNMAKTVEREMEIAPRTWLAKKVASLRGLYGKYLAKAKAAKDMGKASVAQKIANVILSVIDWIMRKLQSGANKIGTQDYRYSFGR